METTTKTMGTKMGTKTMGTKTTRDRRIFLNASETAKLRNIFGGTSRVTIWKALTYQSESMLARKIRHVALTQLGGTPTQWMPDCLTSHEEADNTMVQTWGERVRLVTFKDTGDVVLYVDGRVSKRVKDISHLDFIELQQEAELTALTL